MKKTFIILALCTVFLLNFPILAHAACSGVQVDSGVASLFPTQFCSAGDLLTAVVKLLLAFISMIAAVVIILAGYRYVTSQGNSEAAGQARKALTNAVIGLVVAILAYTLVAVVSNTLGTSGGSNPNGSGSPPPGNETGPPVNPDNPDNPTPVTDPVQAARNRLISATSISYNGPNANKPYTNFRILIPFTAQDITDACTGKTVSARVNGVARASIPFVDGSTGNFQSDGSQIDSSGGQMDMTISTINADVQQDIDPNKTIPFTISVVTSDGGCSFNYTVNKSTSSFGI